MRGNEKKCARCAEVIKKDALICKHCGAEFSLTEIAEGKAADAKAGQRGAAGCLVLVGLLLVIGTCSKGDKTTDAGGNDAMATVPSLSVADAKALEIKNAAKIKTDLAKAKALPSSDVEANLNAYQALLSLAPANPEFAKKRDEYQARAALAKTYIAEPAKALEITKFDWEKGGFGSVQLVRLTVKNNAPFAIKDFELTCNHQGPSGTDMDSNVRIVYELVPANASKRISEINMGLIASQAASSRCEITKAIQV
ncbi:zinc ribbon domain-containing protein [Sphingomonas sp. S1-29]|uniref:hypothetical protein n=1 Tax=Sphingomonas sp. S1-29 TaxID=2991074 RepID=UPI002240D424|nr:hypothetical protein [Sphingomonas sp. S1-29]UZK68293.1 zinc ribbon domain-containing protein [Sphingomonas sp. S1-29]